MALEKQTSEALERADVIEILRCEVGSTVHGLDVAGTDDRDELGVCIEPADRVIGLHHFEQIVLRSQPQGARSQPGDLDLTIYGLRKFASLALKGNPSILLLFNVPDDKCEVLTDLGRELRALAWAFASRKAGAAFLGYMQQQRQRLMGERGQMSVKRPELVEKYGFDTKYAGHIVRLGYQGVDYMNTGSFPIPMPQEQRETILAIRTGQVPENDVLTLAGELEIELKNAIDSTMLPDQPNYRAVNDFLIAAYQSALNTVEERMRARFQGDSFTVGFARRPLGGGDGWLEKAMVPDVCDAAEAAGWLTSIDGNFITFTAPPEGS